MQVVKKFIAKQCTLIMMTSIALIAVVNAEAQPDKPYIEVNGQAKFNMEAQKYMAEIVLSPTVDYNYTNVASFDEIKRGFSDALRQNGYKEDQFVEDRIAYSLGDYPGDGTLYKFETQSAEAFFKLKELTKLRGIRVQGKKITYKIADDAGTLMKIALEDAQKKAGIIAGMTNKKLGSPQFISDLNSLPAAEQYNYGYNAAALVNYYQITVRFSVD